MDGSTFKSWVPPDLRFRVGRALLHHPSIATPYVRLRPAYDSYRFRPDCDLAIDGYPRSANTYTWHAFRLALGPRAEVRGHTHSPATLINAVRHSVPAVLLLRDPDDAVSSYVQQATGVSISAAYAAYIDFHQPLRTWLQGIVVAEFCNVVTDLGTLSDRINERFGTTFPRYEPTVDNEASVRKEIETAARQRLTGTIREAGVARPSPHRKNPSEILRNLGERTEAARKYAQSMYQAFAVNCHV